MYFGLEVIQEYACGGENVFCEAGPAMVREFLHGDPARYPEAVAMVTYDLMPTEVPYGEPPAPPTSVNPQAYHYLHDVLGSVIGVVDESGDLVERYTYDPYGKVLIEKWGDAQGSHWVSAEEPSSGLPYSPIGNPFMWTGHRYDSVAGLYYTKFRFYEPVLGRWLQRDPIEYEGGSINLYEYVLSSPLDWIDPFGLKITCDQNSRNPKGLNKDLIDALKKICPCNDYDINEKTGEVYASSIGPEEQEVKSQYCCKYGGLSQAATAR